MRGRRVKVLRWEFRNTFGRSPYRSEVRSLKKAYKAMRRAGVR
jgi:hypothetical protein